MINKFRNIFKKREALATKRYDSISGFFMHASKNEQKKVLTEAARLANEDQLRVFNEAKAKAN